MTKKSIAVLIMLLICTTVAFCDSGLNIKEGEWEITTKMEMKGMPMQMPAYTHTQCLTKNDMVPNSSQQSDECKIKNITTSGGTVSWKMECDSGNGKTIGSGKVTYSGDTMKGTIKMEIPGQMEMTSKMTGKRIGPCK